jgi:hypothetical protein
MPSSLCLGPFASFPEPRSVIRKALMAVLPSLVLGHMIFAESLVAIFTLLVLWRYTSAFVAFFQRSNQLGQRRIGNDHVSGLSLSMDWA